MVGTGRFELPTPRTPSECSTRLSHVPTRVVKPVQKRTGRVSRSQPVYHPKALFGMGRPLPLPRAFKRAATDGNPRSSLATLGRRLHFVVAMPVEPDSERQQFPLVVLMIAVVVAGLVFWGIWKFLAHEHHPAQKPPEPTSELRQHMLPQ